ncbi:hypothetical protein [Methanobrevibacter sp.]|uniref:hypothetical protein n=1 Tax=Methanobrevibacter sp. TaxID=66852 RepID=UPI003974F65D
MCILTPISLLAVAFTLSANIFTPEVHSESRDFKIFRTNVRTCAEFEEFTSLLSTENGQSISNKSDIINILN